MMSWADQQLEQLTAGHPDWEIWYVRLIYPVGYIWCARRKGYAVAEINADSPASLETEIAKIERNKP